MLKTSEVLTGICETSPTAESLIEQLMEIDQVESDIRGYEAALNGAQYRLTRLKRNFVIACRYYRQERTP